MSEIGNRENSADDNNHSRGERENVGGRSEIDKTVDAVAEENPNVKGTDDQFARGDVGASFCQAVVPYRSPFDILDMSPATTHEMFSPGPPTFVNGRPTADTYSLVGRPNGQYARGDVGASICQAVVPYRSVFDILGINPENTHANGTSVAHSKVGIRRNAPSDTDASICQAVVPYRSPFDILGINPANSDDMINFRASPTDSDEHSLDAEASPSDEIFNTGASPIDTVEHEVNVEASPSDIDIEYIDRARNDIADFVEEFRGYLAFIDALDALSECLDGVSAVVFRENEVVFQRRRVFDEDDDDDDEDDMNPFINLCCSH